MFNIVKEIKKYLSIKPRPVYNPYDYPHRKFSAQDLLETVDKDLIVAYRDINCRIKPEVGRVNIEPIIDRLLPIFRSREIEVISANNINGYKSQSLQFYLRFDGTDEYPPDDIFQYYEEYLGKQITKLRREYIQKYGLISGTRFLLFTLKKERVEAFILDDRPFSLAASSRNYQLTGELAVEKTYITAITLELELNI